MDLILMKLAGISHARASLLCVVAANGGVPRHAGSKMLVFPDGSLGALAEVGLKLPR